MFLSVRKKHRLAFFLPFHCHHVFPHRIDVENSHITFIVHVHQNSASPAQTYLSLPPSRRRRFLSFPERRHGRRARVRKHERPGFRILRLAPQRHVNVLLHHNRQHQTCFSNAENVKEKKGKETEKKTVFLSLAGPLSLCFSLFPPRLLATAVIVYRARDVAPKCV